MVVGGGGVGKVVVGDCGGGVGREWLLGVVGG